MTSKLGYSTATPSYQYAVASSRYGDLEPTGDRHDDD
jgi:hypothetical protein